MESETTENAATNKDEELEATNKDEELEADGCLRVRPLGIIFDIDGTLIAESRHIPGMRIRPYAVDLLAWCRKRGHRIALFTAAHSFWAECLVKKVCPLVQRALGVKKHSCVKNCTATFDFSWGRDKMRNERPLKRAGQRATECYWCDFYSGECHICACYGDPNDCPCRRSKDIRCIWWSGESAGVFQPGRTLLVENTPQTCRYNYGNAIYVPTYRGGVNDGIFQALQRYIQETLEPGDVDVRDIAKCTHPPGPHACFRQCWWPDET